MERHVKDIMQIGLTLKFSQNKLCFKAIQATGKTTLVELSTTDKLWVIGLNLKDTVTIKIGWERFRRMYAKN